MRGKQATILITGTRVSRQRNKKYFMCDFETTVYEGQIKTEVWASACVEFFTEDVKIFHSIDEQFNYFKSLNTNVCAYYHNLKFDGAFWISYLINELHFTQAFEKLIDTPEQYQVEWLPTRYMPNNSFRYAISDKGMWYYIEIKVNNHIFEIRDSLKLLPFSVKKIGESFGTKHKKLDMEYKGYRYAGCEITKEEQEYIANDVLVVKEALEIMYQQGHNKLTIGSCCLEEFKSEFTENDYSKGFPNLYEIEIDPTIHKYKNAGEWIRKSYRGGWCYLVKGKANKIYRNGTTADVNSLYPSMMSSESGNAYPIGEPTFWNGNYIPDEALAPRKYYFVRIKTRFYLKKNMLPFVQIKGNPLYRGTESLFTSDVYDKNKKEYYNYYITPDGTLHDTRVELTLTMTDYILLQEHYDLVDFEILDGCYFNSVVGIFDEYIYKYKKIKLESKGAIRELAKLFLNNLYGKMATSTDSSFKVAYEKEDKSIGFMSMIENKKKPGYIPIGSAITSYARNFTIRAAQKNYYGKDKPGFIYADTDSIHCDLPPSKLKGIEVHDKNFCCWKLESCWDKAIFVRQKTYIEHIFAENLQIIDKPYDNIKCAGMPKKCKELLKLSMNGYSEQDLENRTDEEIEFIKTKRDYTDFKVGLIVPGKLMPKRIEGGIILVDTPYEMRDIF